jgi:hypothetical protein
MILRVSLPHMKLDNVTHERVFLRIFTRKFIISLVAAFLSSAAFCQSSTVTLERCNANVTFSGDPRDVTNALKDKSKEQYPNGAGLENSYEYTTILFGKIYQEAALCMCPPQPLLSQMRLETNRKSLWNKEVPGIGMAYFSPVTSIEGCKNCELFQIINIKSSLDCFLYQRVLAEESPATLNKMAGVFFASAKSIPAPDTEKARQAEEIERLRQENLSLQAAAEDARKKPNLASTQGTSVTPNLSASQRRIALVVGNADYKVRPLKNPRNDADDISRVLRSSGFEVIDLRDATLTQMRTGVRQFGDRLINNDVGLVYYSGHGVEVKGRNYFIPVNADIMREDEIADQWLDVELVLEKMSTASKGVNILIVDACRNDPFGRSFKSASLGLAQMDAPRGTIIAYATSPGKVAADGEGRNSPYTKNLIKAMQQPNKPIEQVFKEVRRAVQEETKNQQTPWENTSLSGDFYFKVAK